MVTHNVQPLPRPAGRYTIRLQVVSAGYKHEASMFVRAKVDTEKKNPLPEEKKNKRPKGPPKIERMGLKNPVGSPRAQKEKTKKLKSN